MGSPTFARPRHSTLAAAEACRSTNAPFALAHPAPLTVNAVAIFEMSRRSSAWRDEQRCPLSDGELGGQRCSTPAGVTLRPRLPLAVRSWPFTGPCVSLISISTEEALRLRPVPVRPARTNSQTYLTKTQAPVTLVGEYYHKRKEKSTESQTYLTKTQPRALGTYLLGS